MGRPSAAENSTVIRLVHFSREECRRHEERASTLLLDGIASTAARGKANEWLERSAWKRSLAALVYGDLLERRDLRVLDVGGGLSFISAALAERHDFTLVERADHEEEAAYRRAEEGLGRRFVMLADWFELEPDRRYDVVVATDVFPNVDQRLPEFVERFLPFTHELRLSLTYYEGVLFDVRRIQSGERLTVKPWGLGDVAGYLRQLAEREGWPPPDERQLVYDGTLETMFGNRRNVVVAWIRP
jgi:hypothetical protein